MSVFNVTNTNVSKVINQTTTDIWMNFPPSGQPSLPVSSETYDFMVSTPDRNIYGFKGSKIKKLTVPNSPSTINNNIGTAPTVVGVWSNQLVWMTPDKKVWSWDPASANQTPAQQGTLPQAAAALAGNSAGLFAFITAGNSPGVYQYASQSWGTAPYISSTMSVTCSTVAGDTIYWGGDNISSMSGTSLTNLSAAGDGSVTALAGLSMTHNTHDGVTEPPTRYLYAYVGNQMWCIFLSSTTTPSTQVPGGPSQTGLKNLAIGLNGFLYWLTGTKVMAGCNPLPSTLIFVPGKPDDNTPAPVVVLPNAMSTIVNTGPVASWISFYSEPDANPLATWNVTYTDTPNGTPGKEAGTLYNKDFQETLIVNDEPSGDPVSIEIENIYNNPSPNTSLVMHVSNASGGWTIVIIGIDPIQKQVS